MNDYDDDYDPYKYRKVKNPTTNWQAMANFLKASVGTGVLAMPVAFKSCGFVAGVILTAILAIITVYCLHIMIRSMYVVCKRKRVPFLSYAESMKAAFKEGPTSLQVLAPIASAFVNGFLAFLQFGICCVYVVFIAETNKQIVDEYFMVWSSRTHIVLLVVPLLLVFSIRTLVVLGYFSTVANILLFVGLSFIFYFVFIDLPSLSDRKAVENISEWPIMFGIVLFSLITLGVILSIEENMRTPKDFITPCGVMNSSMLIVSLLYIAVGFCGYWKYGDNVKGSITLNIPQDEVLSQIIKCIFGITVMMSYPLQGYVTIDIIWAKYLSLKVEDTSKHTKYEMCTRAAFVFLTIISALIFPDIGLFLSIVGAFCLSVLGIVCPAILELLVKYDTGYGPCQIRLFVDVFLIIFGIFGCVVGTYVGVCDLIKAVYY